MNRIDWVARCIFLAAVPLIVIGLLGIAFRLEGTMADTYTPDGRLIVVEVRR